MSIKAETVGTVRERERESYTLLIKSVALLSKLTHTCKFNKKIYIHRKNQSFLCLFCI